MNSLQASQYMPILRNSLMFQGMQESEIGSMLGCINARVATYDKNEYILRNGDSVQTIGMVLSGRAMVMNDDIWGNHSIISEILPGTIYGESYSTVNHLPAQISVMATEATEVMLFDVNRITTSCSSACGFHARLIQNILNMISQKNIYFMQKMDCLSKKTIREKLMTYLSNESQKAGSLSFTIPYDRQELADYLYVDRAALSSVIGKLQKEGILTCKKNHFTLRSDAI